MSDTQIAEPDGRTATVSTQTAHRAGNVGLYNTPGPDSSPASAPVAYKRTSWGAIFAGTLAALAIQILLGMLGIAIGASTIDPATETNPAAGLGTGAAIWFGISTLISLFAGGWVLIGWQASRSRPTACCTAS